MKGNGKKGFHRSLTPRDASEAAGREVDHHLAELVDRLVDQGMEREAARVEAERRFGSPRVYRTRLERDERRRRTAMKGMEVWGLVTASATAMARTMRKSPGFAAGVVLTLALGIGANATMFSVLDRLLFSPPDHVVHPDEVRRVVVDRPFMGQRTRSATITFPDYESLREVDAFASVAAWSGPRAYTIGSGAGATRAEVALASWDFFRLLGVQSVAGRLYGEDEDQPGVAATAVISEEYWDRAFGRDPAAVGRTILVSGESFTVVGVAPAGFTGVNLTPVDIWLPLVNAGITLNGSGWKDSTGWYWLSTVARLAPGATSEAAADQATALHLARREEDVESGHYPREARVELDPLILARGPEASGESKVARWLGGVSLLVLLIACANVANLFLARGTRRRREVAVRLALGAGRGRLVGMMVAESVALALVGAGVALLLAFWGGAVIRNTLLPGVLFSGSIVGERVALFTLATALVSGLLAGVGPAFQATRTNLAGDLSMGAGASAGRRSRTRAVLTIAQAALSVVLLVGAGLFIRSVAQVRGLDLGLDTNRLVVATLELEKTGVFPLQPEDSDKAVRAGRNAIYAEAMRRVNTLPGVTAVAETNSPFQWAFATEVSVPGLDSLPQLPGGGPYYQDVTPGYMSTVGLRVLRGRDLAESDGEGAAPVALVSETMARTVWPDADPLGQCLKVGEDATECTTVVGVVEDASRGELQDEPYMAYYMPLAQREDRVNALYIRADRNAQQVAAAVAPILRGFDPHVRYATVRTLQEMLEPQARAWTLGATMFTVFGLLALLVAAIGLYGVLAFDVAQRTRELGIRTALGAERARLLRSVVRSGMALGSTGVVLGLVVALVAGRFASDLLFEVSPRDPIVLAGVAGVLLLVSLMASLLPGLRATRVDPMVALRVE